MKTLYVISHTEAAHHLEGRVGGWYDSALTEKGVNDAITIANRLKAEANIEAVFSSDLARAKSTAEQIVKATGATLDTTAALREMSFGKADGQVQAWLDERIRPEDGTNRMDHRIVEGAETKREFAGRIYTYLDSLSLPAVSVISTHAFAASYVIAWWIGMPLDSVGYVNFGIQSGKITKLVEDDFFKNRAVAFLNQ
ncbi:MAG: histidine phosphatase family protein [Reinekea sp.]|nr:histidine phosphatase family protein [Reinekea sp.]